MKVKNKFNKTISLVLAGLLLLSCGSNTLNVEASKKKTVSMRSYVQKTLAHGHARGTTVIVKDGKVEKISYGYGYYRKHLNAGSSKLLYPLGSLQKVVTGAIITQLIYKKKFSQNTKISRWYPLMKDARKITVGQLMTHTSGINISGTETNHGINFSEPAAIDWTVAKINITPRSQVNKFNYNNANFVLLAGIIRKVTGKSYATNVKNRIIKPLHLHQTYIYQNIPRKKTDAISYLYRRRKNYQNPVYANKNVVSQLPGAGNLFSAPMDYYKIIKGLSDGKILSAKQYHYMTHLKARKSTYSGGIYARRSGKLQMAYGNFGDTHFANWMQLTKDNKNGMIMFLNQTQDSKSKNKAIGYKILKHIKKNTFQKD